MSRRFEHHQQQHLQQLWDHDDGSSDEYESLRPNSPPPPPYRSEDSAARSSSSSESYRADKASAPTGQNDAQMQEKVRRMIAKLKSSNLQQQTPLHHPRTASSSSSSSSSHRPRCGDNEVEANTSGVEGGEGEAGTGTGTGTQRLSAQQQQAFDLRAEEERAKARRQKMAEFRQATIQRVRSRNQELQEIERKKALEVEDEEQQMVNKARSEELAQRKARREALSRQQRQHQVKLEAAAPPSSALVLRATRHYRRLLLVKFGLSPWMQFVSHFRMCYEKACHFYDDLLLERQFGCWKSVWRNSRIEKMKMNQRMTALATSYYRRQLMRFIWRKWKLHRKLLKAKALTVGGQFSRFAIRRRAFVAWRIAQERRERMRAVRLQNVAIPHGRIVLCKHYMQRWKDFLEVCKLQRDVQLRSDLTWSKVQGWLVDKR